MAIEAHQFLVKTSAQTDIIDITPQVIQEIVRSSIQIGE
jgi:thiamine phosphate synthase YjbQ (UPF0047 family)